MACPCIRKQELYATLYDYVGTLINGVMIRHYCPNFSFRTSEISLNTYQTYDIFLLNEKVQYDIKTSISNFAFIIELCIFLYL